MSSAAARVVAVMAPVVTSATVSLPRESDTDTPEFTEALPRFTPVTAALKM